MNDTEIINLVNSLELRCPTCEGNVTIIGINGDKISFKHNLYSPGQSIPSNDTKCHFFNNEIRLLVNSYKANSISETELRNSLIGLSKKY